MDPILLPDSTVSLANGFLPTRASWMLDFVVVAMVGVTLALSYSLYLVRWRRKLRQHRNIQIVIAVVLAFALVAFEVDVRFISPWRALAESSPYYASGMVDRWLWIHLGFAIPTPLIWGAVIFLALRYFKTGFNQGRFNRFHRISGRVAAGFMYGTAVTGWIFYYLAFVA